MESGEEINASGGETIEMTVFPEQEKMRRVLKYIYDELKRGGKLKLKNQFRTKKRRFSQSVKTEVGHYNEKTGENVTENLGLAHRELSHTLDRLTDGGYVRRNRSGGRGKQEGWEYTLVTEKGLRLIGELPDPQDQLIQRFETAIYVIEHDDRLTEAEKKREIDWLEEGKLLARSLTTDAIKAILRGDLTI
jgi:DNA-binding transcriptional ArsR family regulator